MSYPRIVLSFFALILSTAVLLPAEVQGQSMAQSREKARGILDKMSAKYQAIPSFSVSFTQSIVNQAEALSESSTGKMAIKGDTYRVDIAGQTIVSNGEKSYVYLEEVNEINISWVDEEEGAITPSTIYDAYKKGFNYHYLENRNGNHIIELIPQNRDDSWIYRIRMTIGSDYSLKSFTYYDRNNTEYGYELNSFKEDPSFPANYFDLVKQYSSAYVVDLTKN